VGPNRRTRHWQDDGELKGIDMLPNRSDVTQLLAQWRAGDSAAESALMSAVYPVLKQIAAQRMSARDAAAFSVTDLVHASYERLIDQRDVEFSNRAHFFAISARVIRRVLIDQVRERNAEKRGADWEHVSLGFATGEADNKPLDGSELLAIDQALAHLEAVQPRAAQVVEMRYFSGMTLEEVAAVSSLSLTTIKRDWQFAMAFLHDQLSGSASA
jgi:RNA polymerase sigma factor (TIGR02999 family)